jgi:hypothetical protein
MGSIEVPWGRALLAFGPFWSRDTDPSRSTNMKTCLTAAAMLHLAAGAMSQAPGLERLYRWLPAPGPGKLAAVGDVNGDGIADVVRGPNRSVGEVWLGNGDAKMHRPVLAFPYVEERVRAIVLADVDGDGDLDVAMLVEAVGYSLSTTSLSVLHNDGSGRFTSVVPPLPTGYPTTLLAAGDLDADGDQDLLVGPSVIWTNNGTGVFQPSSTWLRIQTAQDSTNATALADLDGDGDTDAYISNIYQGSVFPGSPLVSRDRVFRNDGPGVFVEAPPPSVVEGNGTLATRAHDFDLDGDLDLVQLTRAGPPAAFTFAWRLLRNDGLLTFTQVWWQAIPSSIGIDVAEWNGDGRADVAVRTTTGLVAFVQGSPLQFAPASLPAVTVGSPILLDVDQDLDTDYIEPSIDDFADHRLVRNVGSGWAQAPLPPTTDLPQSWIVDLADVNGDGALDLVRGPIPGIPGELRLGDGNGVFVAAASGDLGLFSADGGDVECGDVDGDGDPDILVGARQAQVGSSPTSRLFRNDGGHLVAVSFPPVHANTVRLIDLDGDSDLDAVLVGHGQINVATNDGSGVFQAVIGSIQTNGHTPWFVQLADFDGDHDVDLLVEFLTFGVATTLFRNDGTAVFQAQATTLPLGLACAGDFDGDGDVDLIGPPVWAFSPLLLYRNDGTGAFVGHPFPALPRPGVSGREFGILPEDLDQDGRLDLVITYGLGRGQSTILWNQGGLSFVSSPLVDWPFWGYSNGFFDFDLDGDRDLMLLGGPAAFLRSTLRHLAPMTLPRIGRPFDLEVRGRATDPYVLGLAFARTRLPTPGFGTLQLDPTSLQVAGFGVLDGAGQARFAASVPNAPSLVGLVLHWQALSGTVPRLGNLLTTELQSR